MVVTPISSKLTPSFNAYSDEISFSGESLLSEPFYECASKKLITETSKVLVLAENSAIVPQKSILKLRSALNALENIHSRMSMADVSEFDIDSDVVSLDYDQGFVAADKTQQIAAHELQLS